MAADQEYINPDQPLPEHLAWLAGLRATGSLVATSGDIQREILVARSGPRARHRKTRSSACGWSIASASASRTGP
jgi:hypothetical protein